MQKNKKIQIMFSMLAPVFALAFFAFPGVISAESLAVNTGTVRLCSILANTSEVLASADNTTPHGSFSLSLSTTKNFSSPVVTHGFNAQTFAHNTTIEGVPMHCTDPVSVPFGEYYYNNVSVAGGEQTWNESKYFDGTATFSLSLTASYNNAFFTEDTSDDITVNTLADGVVVVDEQKPNRTVIVLNVFKDVLNNNQVAPACNATLNLISNGGFEYPVVNHPLKWTSVPLNTSDLVWTSYDTVTYPYIEFQAGYTEGITQWLPHTGVQYAEIDGGTGHDVSQVVTTIPGHVYKLSYWVSPRPNQSALVNVMNVTVNGERIDTYSHAGSDMTQWSQRTYSFIATSTQTRISFTQGQDFSIGLGVFLDDVSLSCAGKVSVPPQAHQCVIPDTLGDVIVETVGPSYGVEPTVADILSTYSMSVDMVTDQQQYQSFVLSAEATSTVTVKYLEGDYSGNGNVFGYYLNNDASTFVPLFLSGSGTNPAYASTTRVAEGYTFTLKVKASSIQFAIKSSASQAAPYTVSTVNAVNASQVDRVLAFNTPGAQSHNDFILAFEDLPVSSSDNDYNDVIVQVVVTGCEKPNTPPTITLIGANPATLTVGQSWIEPGATASDLEDGNITNNIVITGTVGTTTPGTYTLTYTVTDSGGLSASTTRQVIVTPVTQPATFTISATKIVCDAESDLPNWGSGSVDISSTTVASFLSTHPHCRPASDWKFQWGYMDVLNPGASFIGEADASTGWVTFGPTNASGVTEIVIPVKNTSDKVWVREVLKDGYINFTLPGNNTDYSAEMYCHQDVLNYDNYDFVYNPVAGQKYYCVAFNALKPQTPVNTPPTITLIGANPATLTVGQSWIEPGATASDLEDGNITNNIVITGTVGTTTPGTYTLTYTVTDSGGLSASTTRQVIVETGGSGPTTGSITFCSLFANKDNVIATSSAGLPFGSFAISLATTTDIANSTIQSQTWTANTFAPNKKIILTQNDADCVTYNNLPFGAYYYSELGVAGSQWIVSSTSPKYNDQFNTPVNNIFDLFPYSSELFTATTTDDATRNVNSDGLITLSPDRREHTLVMVTKYADAPACMLPEFTSVTAASGEVGKAFSFTLGATSTTPSITYSLATTSLPAGVSFEGNIISGTPTVSGTFSVVVSAINPCGTTTQTLVITIAPKQDVCTTCGGGGGGGGNGPIITSLAITNEKVVEITPGVALVTWNTNLPATKEVGYGTASQPASFIVAPFGYATSTVRVSSPLETVHSYTIPIESGKTYYFRPVSTDGKTTVAGIELVLNPGTGIGGGNETPNACYYLFDYLKQGWNNNSVEVKKLQVFLRDLEGFTVEITGVYDDQTVAALNAFQNRYKDDILTPWGHTAPTSFTYITTKKKVNEIYCKMAFPVTAQQQAEIDAFRTFLMGLTNAGVTLGTPTEEQLNQPVIVDINEVGAVPAQNNTTATSTLGTLAGTEAQNATTPAGRLTANVIESGKKLGNFAAAIFTWPWDWARGWFGTNDDNQCQAQSVFSHWFNWILIIVIITMTYLWYRERKANKEALEINEELDLLNK